MPTIRTTDADAQKAEALRAVQLALEELYTTQRNSWIEDSHHQKPIARVIHALEEIEYEIEWE